MSYRIWEALRSTSHRSDTWCFLILCLKSSPNPLHIGTGWFPLPQNIAEHPNWRNVGTAPSCRESWLRSHFSGFRGTGRNWPMQKQRNSPTAAKQTVPWPATSPTVCSLSFCKCSKCSFCRKHVTRIRFPADRLLLRLMSPATWRNFDHKFSRYSR